MRLLSPIRFSLFLTLILTLTGCIGASNIKPKTPDCNITCYITRLNSQGAVLQLVVKAGSLQEEDDERGFAHFVEHMAFNDTEKYPKEALFRKLRELGMEMGSHTNGHTDFDNTAYFISLDEASDEQLDTAISILAQWAQHVQFNPDVVEAEKPVLEEEWRYRSPQQASIALQQLRELYQGSHYGERFPIGTLEGIQGASAEKLEAFYRRWYHPDNLAVIVTGGVDEDTIKALINKHFTERKNGQGAKAKSYELNLQNYPQAQVFVSNSVKNEVVSLRYFVPFPIALSKDQILENMLNYAVLETLHNRLNNRLSDVSGEITGFSTDWYQWTKGHASAQLSATLSGDKTELATRLLVDEVSLLLAEGISPDEWENWTLDLLESLKSQTLMTGASARRLSINHFLNGREIVSQPEWYRFYQEHLPDVTLERLDQVIYRLFQSSPHWELQTNTYQETPTELQLADWLQGDSQKLSIHRTSVPSSDDNSDINSDTLWQIQPEAEAKLLSSRMLGNWVKEWQFANGMTVMHRYSRAVPGTFYFSLMAEGGLNHVTKEQLPQARSALDVIGQSGLRQLDGVALGQWLEKKNAVLQPPQIDFFARGLSGQANSDDLEEVLQLLHVALTEGRVDDSVLARYLENTRRSFFRRGSTKQYILRRYLDTAFYNNHPALKVMTRNDLEPLTRQAMEQVYQDHFYGAQNYRLVIAGDIGRDKVFPKVFKHIATLPASDQVGMQILQTYPYPKKSRNIDLTGGAASATQLFSSLSIKKEVLAKYSFDQIQFLTFWIDQQLMQELREKQGHTYQVSSGLEGLEKVRPDFTLSIHLNTDPEKVDEVRAALDQQLKAMLHQPPEQEDIERWQASFRDRLQGNYSHPKWLALVLAMEPVYGFDNGQVIDAQARSQPPTQAQLVEMLNAFLSEDAIRIDTTWRPKL